MFLPSGKIIFIDKLGNDEIVANTDINSFTNFVDEVLYLIDKIGYNKDNYKEAIYTDYETVIRFRVKMSDI